jgi:hypothetical protein
MDMRHRSTPVETCQRYVLRVSRVNSNDRVTTARKPPTRGRFHRLDRCCGPYLCKSPQNDTTQARVPPRHADAWGDWRRCLWTTVDPRADGLLSSSLRAPQHDQPATPAFCGSIPRLRPLGSFGQGYKGQTDSRGIEEPRKGTSFRYRTTCGQRCGLSGYSGPTRLAQPEEGV